MSGYREMLPGPGEVNEADIHELDIFCHFQNVLNCLCHRNISCQLGIDFLLDRQMDYMGEAKAKSITQMGKLSGSLKLWTVETGSQPSVLLEPLAPARKRANRQSLEAPQRL